MVIMDPFSRRIIGFAVHRGDVGGEALCSMFREIISNIPTPKYLSLDNDPLYRFDRWAPELEALMINPIYSIPLTPVSQEYVSYYASLVSFVRMWFVLVLSESLMPCCFFGKASPSAS